MTAGSTRLDDHVDIRGVNVSAITMEDAAAVIQHWIAARMPNYVCVTGVHGIIESRGNPRLRRIHNEAGLVTPDGMPLVWMARCLGFNRTCRLYGPDLMRAMSELSAARGYRQFYYGGDHGITELLKQRLTREYPGLRVAGTLTPPFRPLTAEEDAVITAHINVVKPDIIWVGLSTPKQELWMAAHLGRIEAPVMIGVRAAFDFLAGAKKQAPVWMRQNGLEWLFRLAQEPRRLWRRYFSIVPRFLVLALLQLMKARRRGPGRDRKDRHA